MDIRDFDHLKANDELLSGLRIEADGRITRLVWIYPFICRRVCIFEIPLGETFSEEKVIQDQYKPNIVECPKTSINGKYETIAECKLVIYCVDDNGVLIRQPSPIWERPVNIRYYYEIQEDPGKGGIFKGLFKKKNVPAVPEGAILHFITDTPVRGSDILYYLEEGSLFCLPFNPEPNREYTFHTMKRIDFFAKKPNIRINNKQQGVM